MSTHEMLLSEPDQDNSQGNQTRKPSDGSFAQQRMKAWEPTYTPKAALRFFLILGIIFTPLGGWLITENSKVKEIRLDYTYCHAIPQYDTFQLIPSENYFTTFNSASSNDSGPRWKRSNQTITYDGVTKNYTLCTLEFSVPENLDPPIFFYYRLSNFYQNHRRYVKSFNKDQLEGSSVGINSIRSSDCQPLAVSTNASLAQGDPSRESIIYPCGLIANSYFNDTFSDLQVLNSTSSDSAQLTTYSMSRTGIASAIDKSFYGKTSYDIAALQNTNGARIVPPPNWVERYPNGYHDDYVFDPTSDESFVVWMRTSSSPTFAKLAMKNDTEIMEKGRYRLEVFSHPDFPAHEYKGTKSVIITTKTMIGGLNSFLGVSATVVGGICIVLGAFFAITMLMRPKKLSDHIYLSRGDGIHFTRKPRVRNHTCHHG
ncbi:LEM3 family, partial [Camillea tinctor]